MLSFEPSAQNQRDRQNHPRKEPRSGRKSVAKAKHEKEDSRKSVVVPTPISQSEDISEICFICAESVVYYALYPCNHRVCHICALRLRVLYETVNCAYCKQERIIFTKDSEKLYLDFKPSELPYEDEKLGISFESEQMMEDSLLLLRFNCPDPLCIVFCKGWPDLRLHVRQCDEVSSDICSSLCTKHKKVFTHEHTLFSQKELSTHFKLGDQNTDQFDTTGFKGHPECGFCRKSFYDDDELFKHCREHHEKCHLCDRCGGQPQYFVNYESLENHFRRDHFICPLPQCLEQKFVVFASEIDLKAHYIEKHPHTLSSQQFKDIRKVTTSFQFEEPSHLGRSRRRQPLTQPSERDESPMSRQERARYMHAGLVPAASYEGRQQQSRAESTVVKRSTALESSFPSLAERFTSQANISRPTLHSGRESIIFENLLRLMKGNVTSFRKFRENLTAYRESRISAEDLIISMWELFGLKVEELGKVVHQCTELVDSEELQVQLLSGWNDWKLTNESQNSHLRDSGLSRNITNTARVLKIKSLTTSATHSRGKHQSVWNVIEQAANPNIQLNSSMLNNRRNVRKNVKTGWPAVRETASSSHLANRHDLEFPSLPPAKTSRPHDFNETGAYGKGFAWKSTNQHDILPSSDPESGNTSKRRRKQKGKQVLFKIGL